VALPSIPLPLPFPLPFPLADDLGGPIPPETFHFPDDCFSWGAPLALTTWQQLSCAASVPPYFNENCHQARFDLGAFSQSFFGCV